MKHSYLHRIAMGIALLFSACSPSTKNFETVSIEQFQSVITGPDVQIVDVRTAQEFLEGHIPGCLNIDVTQPDFNRKADSLLNKSHKVAIYCRSGNRSKKAAAQLQKMGFKVVELGAGFNGWKQAGLPYEK